MLFSRWLARTTKRTLCSPTSTVPHAILPSHEGPSPPPSPRRSVKDVLTTPRKGCHETEHHSSCANAEYSCRFGSVVGPVVFRPPKACVHVSAVSGPVKHAAPPVFKLQPKPSRLLKTYAPEKLPGKKFEIRSTRTFIPVLIVWRPRTSVLVSPNSPRRMLVKRGLKKFRPTTRSVTPPSRMVASGLMLFAWPGSLSRVYPPRATFTILDEIVEVSDPVRVSVVTSEAPVCSKPF